LDNRAPSVVTRSMPERPRGTVTFLFTDVEGSTRLLRHLGESYGNVLQTHQRLLREAFAAHGGEEVDTQGDAFFFVFSRARDAAAAVDGQRALAAHEWPEGGARRAVPCAPDLGRRLDLGHELPENSVYRIHAHSHQLRQTIDV